MPRKKKVSLIARSAYDQLLAENQMLRKELDTRSDRYNLVEPVRTQEVNKYIDVPQVLKSIEQPYQLQQYLKEFFAKGVALSYLKNHDYGNGDVFGNFREFGTQGFLVRISDKWARIKTFAASGKLLVKDESVLDTLIDLANYCALLGAWLYNQKNEQPR